jgi:hypothetical protein
MSKNSTSIGITSLPLIPLHSRIAVNKPLILENGNFVVINYNWISKKTILKKNGGHLAVLQRTNKD